MRTLSYAPARKQYAVYTVDSLGSAVVGYGQVNGDPLSEVKATRTT